MIHLTDAQALAAATPDRLINVVSAPGSGKTTIAAERYGYLRYQAGDLRGVLGLTFNRAAAAELRERINRRWGANCIMPAHRVATFDHLHVDLLTHLIEEKIITWQGVNTDSDRHDDHKKEASQPTDVLPLDVRDDYRGLKGFRFLEAGQYKRLATLNNSLSVVSISKVVKKYGMGIGTKECHENVLKSGIISHEDVRSILEEALKFEEPRKFAADWLSRNYRALVIDEVYDADSLDLNIVRLASDSDLSVTLIGDPWQAIYKWRGATPQLVENILRDTSEHFKAYQQPESFRFQGDQMPQLAADLRQGLGVSLPEVDSSEVDVALARNWTQLWSVGDNVLPLAFHTVNNNTDAAMNLLLDVVTRARLSTASYGRESAIMKLGLDRGDFQAKQDRKLMPIINSLIAGKDETEVLDDLRGAIKSFGLRKPSRLHDDDKEAEIRLQLTRLAERLKQKTVIPGLTVFQAKGLEWERVGVALSHTQLAALTSGLHELEEEHCIIYVAITRARRFCGLLSGAPEPKEDQLQLDM